MLKKKLKDIVPITMVSEISKLITNPYSTVDIDNEIIFIHIPKTAGTSILKHYYNINHNGHFRQCHYRTWDKNKFEKYKKICVVRNPWDRFISAYMYIESNPMRGEFLTKFKQEVFHEINDFEKFSSKFLNSSKFRNKVMKWDHFRPQWDYVTYDNNYNIDILGKFESINDFEITLRKSLGISDDFEMMSKENAVERSCYKSFYTDDLTSLIYDLYEREIKEFKYEF